MRMQRLRCGWSRIEVLVLAGMGLVSVALAVPATQDARETANRTACANHLKQIALAAHQYHDAHKTLPPGWLGPVAAPGAGGMNPVGQGNGPFPYLLPYLGAKSSFDKLHDAIVWDPNKFTADTWYSSKSQTAYNIPALEVAATPLTVMQCPADYDTALQGDANTDDGPLFGRALFVIGASMTSADMGGMPGDPKTSTPADPLAVNWGHSAPGEWQGSLWPSVYDATTGQYNPFARVNYMPVGGLGSGKSPFYHQFEGVFTNRSDITFAMIGAADGTSHTLMFGETSGQFYPAFGDNTLQNNLFGAVGNATARGLQQRCAPGVMLGLKAMPLCDNKSFTTGGGQKARYGVFSSNHPAGVQFAFCDGSVRLIRPGQTWKQGSPDWYLFQQMAGFHDGFHRDVSNLLP